MSAVLKPGAADRSSEQAFYESQKLPADKRGLTFEALFYKQLQQVTARIHDTENLDQIMLDVSPDICKLLNALVGSDAQRTNEISEALDSGKHTTTFTRLFTIGSHDSWVIDSPGMQVFGLAHFSRNQIELAFPEFRDVIGKCRFRDCKHLHEPNCALQALLAEGKTSTDRLSYLRKFCAEGEAVPHYARH